MQKQGFTLIELMIVVAIIAFLAALALPRYLGYFDRARQAEVAMNLASLHTAQQAHFMEHGTYSAVLSGPGSIGWQPEGYKGGGKQENFYYTYGFNVPGAQEGVHFFTGKLEAPQASLGSTYADESGFKAGAAAIIQRVKKTDVWSVDESRRMNHEVDGVNQ